MPYIFGKLWHLAIIWAIRKAFQCILKGVRILLANHTRISPTSENDSYILFISLMVISFSAVERRINVSKAKFAWDSRKSSKISSEVVIKCEGWACTIVKDFEPAEKTNRSRSRGKGGNKGMYSSSEASVSRADSPVIFVVGLCFSLIGWLWASCVLSY